MAKKSTFKVSGTKAGTGTRSHCAETIAEGLSTRAAADAVIREAVSQGWSGISVDEIPSPAAMRDTDTVIRHAAAAAAANANQIHTALSQYLAAVGTPNEEGAERHLRAALVAQAANYESSVGNGSTLAARVAAAQSALDAWHGTDAG